MDNCQYCNKVLESKRRTYCNSACQRNYRNLGKAREQYVYVESDQPDVSILMEGAWMMYQATQTEEECIADFMRVWKRAPEHCIYDPKTPFWRYAGPVWDEEEISRRWLNG